MPAKTFKPRNGRGRATNEEIIGFWVANAGNPGVEMPAGRGSVFTGGKDDDTIYSYGTHFPLAQIMKGQRGKPRAWFLINGDRWSGSGWITGSTSYQQGTVRADIAETGLPSMIVPFSCLGLAGIHRTSIRRIEVLPDRRERVTHREYWAQVPSWVPTSLQFGGGTYGLRQLADDRWEWHTDVHILGESLFSAEYNATYNNATYQWRRRRALFLSGFDQQEPGLSYFLCELPGQPWARTVAQARQALKPRIVADSETAGLEVLRQGDIFAVPMPGVRTRGLPGPSSRSTAVLDTNHFVTEARFAASGRGNVTYARGILHHQPPRRRPDHVRRALGDQRTWYMLVRNLVPLDAVGNSRAWAPAGGQARVD